MERPKQNIKYLLWATMLPLLLIARNAEASSSVFRITSDAGGLNCLAEDRAPGTLVAYVHVWSSEGAQGASFRIAQSDGFTGELATIEYLEGSFGFGDPGEGIEVAFTTCATGLSHIAKVTYITFGASETCSFLAVAPNASSGAATVQVYQCGLLDPEPAGTSGPLAVNADYYCDLCALPAKTSTWGRIKALYR